MSKMSLQSRILIVALSCFVAAGCRDGDDSSGPRPISGTPPAAFVPDPEPPAPEPDPDESPGLGWVVQESGIQQDITSISTLNGFQAWAAAGGAGSMLVTDDGGSTWTSAQMGGNFKQVEFVDAMNGWAITGQQVLSSVDGGQNWFVRKTALENSFVAMSFISAATGWLLTEHDELLLTTDGGENWATVIVAEAPPPAHRELRAIKFVDGANGWILARDVESGGEAIYKSVNGGQTWEKQFVIADVFMTDISAVSPNEAWVVGIALGGGGVVLATTDGGENWEEQQVGPVGELRAVHFVDSLTGWAVGSSILHTEDGGATWTPQASPAGVIFFDVDFVSEAVGWAVGSDGTILRTTTGGD